jgi:large subunit ribosomal protein L4
MYKQKGTGRARTSTIRAPHKKGGNKAHPQKPKHWAFKLNKKVRKLALKSALSAKFSQGNVWF